MPKTTSKQYEFDTIITFFYQFLLWTFKVWTYKKTPHHCRVSFVSNALVIYCLIYSIHTYSPKQEFKLLRMFLSSTTQSALTNCVLSKN